MTKVSLFSDMAPADENRNSAIKTAIRIYVVTPRFSLRGIIMPVDG
jgi:hypothetical protein